MSRPIDEKIVKMSMDKSDFQKKAEETIGIFGKLKNAFTGVKPLNLSSSVKSIGDLNTAADRTTLSGLSSAVEGVASKFTTLGIIAVTALQNIANRAIDAGITLAKSLSTDQIRDGFEEYELKMGSIQTIMSNTMGKSSLEEVNKVLDELNTYSDKTIYNFAEMTRNIGTFTAAGVDLETSASAIQGIANLAAVSGSNSQQASTAMYQLSQAIANGKVNLQDWNSVVNAGMGGKLFQNALMDTAEKMGINVDRSKAFRETLADGWLTTEVLTSTLKDFAEDDSMLEAATKVRTFTQLVETAKEAMGSGWANTFELIFGDFEKSGALWTSVNDVFDEIIGNAADARNALVGGFVDLGGMEVIFKSVSDVFQGVSKAASTVKEAFHNIFPPATASSLLNIANGIRSLTQGLIMSEETAGKVRTIFEGVFSVFSAGITIAKTLGSALLNLIPEGIGTGILDLLVMVAEIPIKFNESLAAGNGLTSLIAGIGTGLGSLVQWIWDAVTGITSFLSGSTEGLSAIGSKIGDILSRIGSAIGEFLGSFNLQDFINVGFIATVVAAFRKFDSLQDIFSGIADAFKELFGGIGDSFGIFDKLGESLSAFTGAVKVGSLVAIAAAIGILAVSLKLLEGIDASDLQKGLATLASVLTGLTLSLAAISGINLGGTSAFKSATILIALSASVLIIAGALKTLSTIDPADMARSLGSLVVIIGSLVAALSLLSTFSGKMLTSGAAMVAFAIAIVIMAQAVKQLAGIDSDSITRSVIALGLIMAELAAFILIVNGSKLRVGSALGLIAVAAAIKMMVSAIEDIATIPVQDLQKGLSVITILLAEFGLLTKLTSGSKMMSSSVGMVLMATAIRMMIEPLREIGGMQIETLIQGLSGLAIVLTQMVLAAQLAKGGLAGAAAMVAMAIAIKILVPPLQALGDMSGLEIARSLTALAGAFVIIGVASVLLAGTGVGLLSFAAGIAAIGLAIGLVGVGVAAFTIALTALATMTVATVAAIVSTLGLLLDGLIDLIPKAVEVVATLAVQLAYGLASAVPQLVDAAGLLIVGILEGLNSHVGNVVTVGVALVVTLAQSLGENIGPLLEAAVQLMTDLIQGMADAMRNQGPELVAAMLSLVGALLEVLVDATAQLIDALLGWIPGVSEATRAMGEAAKEGLRERFDAGAVGDEKGQEFIEGINGRGAGARSAGNALSNNANDGAAEVDFFTTGSTQGTDFASGVTSQTTAARGGGSSLGGAAKSGAESVSLRSSGVSLGQGLANGIASMWGTVKTAASNLASAAKSAVEAVLAIFSPSRVAHEDGVMFGLGLANGISSQEDSVWNQAAGLANAALDAVRGYAEAFSDAILSAIELAPVITPVLDLRNIQNGDIFPSRSVAVNQDGLRFSAYDTSGRLNSSRDTSQAYGDGPTTSGDTYELNVHIDSPVVTDEADIRELEEATVRAVDRSLGKLGRQKKNGWATK